MNKFDNPPAESTDLESLENEYSSGAPESLETVDGKPVDLSTIEGNTGEEKRANLSKELEARPQAHLKLSREVGRFKADIRRGWNDDQESAYESMKLEGATKTAEMPEFGETTLKNIRMGVEKGKQAWGDAEFDSLNVERPKLEDFQELYDKAKAEMETGTSAKEKIATTFTFNGREVKLEVASKPQEGWGGKDYHVYANWSYGDMPVIFEAKFPMLSTDKHAPDERPMTDQPQRFHLSEIQVNLDEDYTPPMGRAKFKMNLEQPGEASTEA